MLVQKFAFILLLVLFLLSKIHVVSTTLLVESEATNLVLWTVKVEWNNDQFKTSYNYSTRMVSNLDTNTNVTDLFVLVDYTTILAKFMDTTLHLQNQGAKGVIFTTPLGGLTPGQAQFVLDGTPRKSITIPVWSVARDKVVDLLNELKSANSYKNITLDNINDTNPYASVNDGGWMYIWPVIVGGFALVNVVLATKKLYILHKYNYPLSVAQACLCSEIVANFVRLLYSAVDPIWSRGILPNAGQHILLTIGFPFSFFTFILFSTYWFELVTTEISLNIASFLTRTKVPFIIAVTIIFAVEFATSIPRALGRDIVALVYVSSAVFIITALTGGIFYMYTTVKVFKFIKGKKLSTKSTEGTALRMFVCSFFMILFVLGWITLATPLWRYPIPFTIIWVVIYSTVNIIGFLQIMSFNPIKKAPASRSVNATGSTKQKSTNSLSAEEALTPRTPKTDSTIDKNESKHESTDEASSDTDEKDENEGEEKDPISSRGEATSKAATTSSISPDNLTQGEEGSSGKQEEEEDEDDEESSKKNFICRK